MASRRALKAILIDLSGTLHIEDVAVPGAQEALNRSDRAWANYSSGVKGVKNLTEGGAGAAATTSSLHTPW